MFRLAKYFVLIGVYLLSMSIANGQCPEKENDLIINTQEKFDSIYLKYPDCTAFTIFMVNNKFIGDPQPTKYMVTLIILLAGILTALWFLVSKLNIE